MLTENGFGIDFDALNNILENGDVITVGFPMIAERLLVDTRTRPGEGPLVAFVEPVANVAERYLWLGKHRGSFGSPEAFSFFVWPQTMRSLRETNALAPLRARLARSSQEAAEALDQVIDRLAEFEVEYHRSAVRGDQPAWHTLWERPVAA